MGFFRSNKVLHLKIRMPSDIEGLMRIMDLFGKHEIEAIQFIDLNKNDSHFSIDKAKTCDKMNMVLKSEGEGNVKPTYHTRQQDELID